VGSDFYLSNLGSDFFGHLVFLMYRLLPPISLTEMTSTPEFIVEWLPRSCLGILLDPFENASRPTAYEVQGLEVAICALSMLLEPGPVGDRSVTGQI